MIFVRCLLTMPWMNCHSCLVVSCTIDWLIVTNLLTVYVTSCSFTVGFILSVCINFLFFSYYCYLVTVNDKEIYLCFWHRHVLLLLLTLLTKSWYFVTMWTNKHVRRITGNKYSTLHVIKKNRRSSNWVNGLDLKPTWKSGMDITPLRIHSSFDNCVNYFNEAIFRLFCNELKFCILSRDGKTVGLSPGIKISISLKSGHSTFVLSTIDIHCWRLLAVAMPNLRSITHAERCIFKWLILTELPYDTRPKTKAPVLSDGENCTLLRSVVSTQY